MKDFTNWIAVQDIIQLLQVLEDIRLNKSEFYASQMRPRVISLLARINDSKPLQFVSALNFFDWDYYVRKWLEPYDAFTDDQKEHIQEVLASPIAQIQLLEASQFFVPDAYNQVFERELAKVFGRVGNGPARQQVLDMRGFDWGGYIARSLLRAGFRDDDRQEAFHNIVVKLLVSPGKLFTGWNPSKHGPLDRRFRRSVWNAIRNTQEKNQNRQKRVQSVDPAIVAGQIAGKEVYNSILDDFRLMVSQKLGKKGLAVLDHRLAGKDTKDLVTDGMGSAYFIKRTVAELKALAQEFAALYHNPSFETALAKAMSDELGVIEKRKATTKARRVSKSA